MRLARRGQVAVAAVVWRDGSVELAAADDEDHNVTERGERIGERGDPEVARRLGRVPPQECCIRAAEMEFVP